MNFFKRFRKEGQLFIQYLIVLPLMIITLWLMLQLIVYVYANNQVDNAADNGALIVARELRGTTDKINVLSTKDQVMNNLIIGLKQDVDNNGFILFSKDYDNNDIDKSGYSLMIENEAGCKTALQDNSKQRVICAYTNSITSNGKSHDQITVRVKVPFRIIGNFVPFLKDNIFLYGTGSATKDISGRFQYY
ncbi:TadE/TadG family type IV pilus assembly protein [Bacillus cereus]|uniref:TadE/TadG family type IV pilus assembly protein n=1 Tax=Bacillus cereus TaxID=1396 RepID=UPI000B4A558A|nr:TadE family protein [Bacillus cereus]